MTGQPFLKSSQDLVLKELLKLLTLEERTVTFAIARIPGA